jgi:hypothetical protein
MEGKHPKPALEEALREHHELLAVEENLSRLLAQDTCPAFKAWIEEVQTELGKLVDMLGPHFQHEEDEGLHEEIAESLPNQSHRLDELIEEHETLLDKIKEVHQLSLRTEMPPQDQELRRQASEFFAALDRHERTERELFLLAIEGEGGAPD